MSDWITIQTKFPNKCILCGEQIDDNSTAYWKKGTRFKHYTECTAGFTEEYSELRIIDRDFEDYLK